MLGTSGKGLSGNRDRIPGGGSPALVSVISVGLYRIVATVSWGVRDRGIMAQPEDEASFVGME
jgi:formiminotetrahydrofolate cyclodeaminase